MPSATTPPTPWLRFTRDEWLELGARMPLPLTEDELATLRGINDRISLDEVADIYLPLSRLLSLYVTAVQGLHRATDTFLGRLPAKVPYIIGLAGSVAVGKSTTARILQRLLSRWPDHPTVDLVTTDGFIHPNRVLEARGMTRRKGFPESYDLGRLVQFVSDIKSGREVDAPIYSHVAYDIVGSEFQRVSHPDIVILEGLNVLQTGPSRSGPAARFVSDFFDFSIYVDAEEALIERWFVDRFLTLRETVFTRPDSFFRRYADLADEEAVETARAIWREINGPNLRQNVQPTRERARLIIRKGVAHRVEEILLRRL